jgi:hypothetical protein
MPSAWIVEAIDILEDGQLCFSSRLPRPTPNQLGLDRFKEGFDDRVEAPIFVKREVRTILVCTAL